MQVSSSSSSSSWGTHMPGEQQQQQVRMQVSSGSSKGKGCVIDCSAECQLHRLATQALMLGGSTLLQCDSCDAATLIWWCMFVTPDVCTLRR
jgi:hypothetical protein